MVETISTQTTQATPLKDAVIHKARLLEEEGYYRETLHLREQDPVTYEVLYAKLTQLVENGRSIIRLISASGDTKEAGECVLGVYTPEGDAVCLSSGILFHVHTISRTIKFLMLNDYEQDVGIHEGDFFFNNDPHIGGMHAQDQNIVTPVFHNGRLIAWVGAMTHVHEVGSTAPGGYEPKATSRFYEGLFLTAIKIAENDTPRRDLEILVDRNVRASTEWLISTRAKMGALIHVRETIKKLVEKYDPGYFTEALDEYIEDSRRAAREKIRAIALPGKYRSRNYMDVEVPYSGEKVCLQTNVEVTIDRDGNMMVDLEGSSREGPFPFNGSLAATEAALFCGLIQTVFYDCRYNDGSVYAIGLKMPKNSIFLANEKAATAKYIGGTGSNLMAALYDVLSRVYYLTATFEEAIVPCNHTPSLNSGGINQYGRAFGTQAIDATAGGAGATAARDGTHTCYAPWNPEGDMGDMEVWEMLNPPVYLGRRQRVDGGGFGKYRGGSGSDIVWMAYHTDHWEVASLGNGRTMPYNQGVMGGYPSPSVGLIFAKNTNLKELFEQKKPYPVGLGSPSQPDIVDQVQGEIEVGASVMYPATQRNPYDMIEWLTPGGAGFGDPLERDPQGVLKDLLERTTSLRAARDIYGVVTEGEELRPESLKIDAAATRELRASMREERKKRGVPAREYVARQRVKLLAGALPDMPKRTINQLLGFSPSWAESFRREWSLPDDFKEVP